MRKVIEFWWIPVLLFAGWLALSQRDATIKYKILADQRIAEVKEAVRVVQRADSIMAARDSAARLERLAWQHERERAKAEEAKAKVHTKQVLDSLAATLTIDQQAQLSRIVTGYETQLALKDIQIKSLDNQVYSLEKQLVVKDSVLSNYRRLTDSLVHVWIKAERAAKPTTWKKITNAAPWIIAGGVLIFK